MITLGHKHPVFHTFLLQSGTAIKRPPPQLGSRITTDINMIPSIIYFFVLESQLVVPILAFRVASLVHLHRSTVHLENYKNRYPQKNCVFFRHFRVPKLAFLSVLFSR